MWVSREVELKLEMRVEEVARVQRSLRRGLGEGIKQHLISVYFDTGKRALRKRGLTLRTRSDGKRRVQTVKAADTTSAYIFYRLEWETKIEGDKLDLKAASRTPVGDVLHGSRADGLLKAMYRLMGRHQPIAELELEFKCGSPTDLFALARSLDRVKHGDRRAEQI